MAKEQEQKAGENKPLFSPLCFMQAMPLVVGIVLMSSLCPPLAQAEDVYKVRTMTPAESLS